MICGENGTGKSTLLKLLLGLYPGYQGEILINGKELGRLNPAKWREKCAFVEQVPFLFEGTVRENVKLGQEVSEKKSIRSWNVLESSIWQTAGLVEINRNCPAANVRKSRLRGRFYEMQRC